MSILIMGGTTGLGLSAAEKLVADGARVVVASRSAEHVEDALKKEREAGGLDKARYEGFGIVNLKATIMPNFLIKSAIKSKQEKTGAIIILDYDYTILNQWGLKNDASNVVVLDKERICRYVNSGKLPPEELAKMIQIIKEYQAK